MRSLLPRISHRACDAGVAKLAIFAAVSVWRPSLGVYWPWVWHDTAEELAARHSDIQNRRARVRGMHGVHNELSAQ